MRKFITKYKNIILIVLTVLGTLAVSTATSIDDELVKAARQYVESLEATPVEPVVEAVSSTTVN